MGTPTLMPTPRSVVMRDGPASLLRFRRSDEGRPVAAGAPAGERVPLLVVPSLINRWYVVDLRPGASMVSALVEGGVDVFCLDWGVCEDEDRYLTWQDVLDRLARAVRRVKRETGSEKVSLLGYCMGGTLCAIHTALHPEEVAKLVNLLGPIDFSKGGLLRRMVDREWFDPHAVAAGGNIAARQMQSGFVALRPTLSLAKWVGIADRGHDRAAKEAMDALDAWADDNVPFPAAAYTTYIEQLYQDNALARGTHHVAGRRVDLSAITCPLLTIAAERDNICPVPSAAALHELVSSTDDELFLVPGGHVGAVVGSRAPKSLYPKLVGWLS